MKLEPIQHPAAWRGNQLTESTFWNLPFHPDWVDSSLHLSPEFEQLLSAVQDELENGYGGVLIRGFPVHEHDSESIRRFFLQVCGKIGTPVSQSASGEKIFSVRNEGFSEDDPRSRGPNTRKRLSFHTDRCDVIAFLCAQPAKSGGGNQVVSSVALYNEMVQHHEELARLLMQPFYYQRHNVDLGNELPYTRQPIFSIFQGKFAANLLRVLIERAYQLPELPELTSEQRLALDTLEELASRPDLHIQFQQEAGDILLLNNWVTFHRREEFVDFSEPEKRRHLLRVWLSVPNSRALDPLFAGNYGSTQAGAIRGGMRPSI